MFINHSLACCPSWVLGGSRHECDVEEDELWTSKPKDGDLDKSKKLYTNTILVSSFFFLNLMFCLYFSVFTWSENRTGFGIRSSKHGSTSHRLSSKADVGLKGPKLRASL